MNSIVLLIATYIPVNEIKIAKKIFEVFYNKGIDFIPDVYGNWEPIKQQFNFNNLDTILNNWQQTPFLWKKKDPKSNGIILLASPVKKDPHCLKLTIDSKKYNLQQLMQLFNEWCKLLCPDFACITELTKNEIEKGIETDVVNILNKNKTKFTFLVTIHKLKKYIPDLYWLTVFGSSYINFFGKEKLLSAPAYSVKELKNGNIILQLTENIQDLEKNVNLVENVRKKIKTHLNKNAFFDIARDKDFVYNTPWKNI